LESALISKANILVVDDDLLIAESNKFLLKKSGYHTVGVATDGLQAVKLAKEKQPDLILMDVNLSSSMDGITAAEEIQKFVDIPIIFLTAYSDPATIERAKKVGPFGYLIKPFDNRELIVAIETSLYKHSFDKKIKEQELLFRTVANFAYEWEFWLLPDLQFKYCSPSCKRIAGYSAEEFTANPKLLFDIVHPEDRDAFEEHIKCNYPERKEEIITDFQFRIIDKQGAVKFLSHTCSAIFDDKKNYLGKRGTNVDITERKLAEEQFKEANLGLQLAIDGGDLGTFDADIKNGKVKVNDRYFTMLGYFPGEIEMTSKFWTSLIHPEDLPKVLDLSNKIESGEIREMEVEYRVKHKSGNWIWLRDKAKGFDYDSSGKPARSAGTHRDITSAKQAEEALRQSEETFRELYEQSPVGYQSLDDEGRFITVNDVWINILGYPKEEVLGKWFGDFLAPEYVEPFRERFPLFKAEGKIHSEFYMMRKNGERAYIAFEGRIGYKPSGEFKQTHCVLSDQTERKLFEESLKKQKEEFETIFNLVPAQIWYKDVHNNFIKVNRQVCEDIGLTNDEVENRPAEELFPAFAKQYYEDDLEVINSGKPKLGIFEQVNTTSGELRWVHTDKVPVFGKDGKVNGLIAFTQDITEQKQAEEALLESEKNFRLLFENSPMGIYVAKANGDIVNVNSALLLILNSPSIEATKQINVLKFPSLVDNGYAAKFVQCVEQNKTISFEIEYTSKWGKTAVLSSYLIPLTDDYGKVVNVYTIMEDITEKKNAEKALRENEEKFRALFEQSGDYALVLEPTEDGSLKIVDANSAAIRVHGYTREELINCPLAKLDASAGKYDNDERSNKLMAGEVLQFETYHQRKDGSQFPVEVIAKAVKIADKPLLIFSTERDITQRKLAEDALHESIERLHIVMNSAPITIFATDSQGIFTLHEGKALKKVGMKPGQNVGMSSFELFSNLPIKESNGLMTTGENVIRRVLAGETVSGLTELKGVFFDNQFAPIQSLDGKVIGLVGVATDITENKKAEVALRENKERWKSLFNNSPNAIAVYQAVDDGNDFVFTDFNLTAQTTENLNRDEVVGKRISQLFPGAEGLGFLEIFRKVWQTGKTEYIKSSFYKDNRIEGWRENIIYKLNTGEIVAIYNDVTERVVAEKELKEKNTFIQTVLDNLPIGIALNTIDQGDAFYFNKKFEEIYGRSAEEIKDISNFFRKVYPDENYRNELITRIMTDIQSGDPSRMHWEDCIVTHEDGSKHFVNAVNIPLYDQNTMVSTVFDVTAVKEAEITLRESEERFRAIYSVSPHAISISDIETGQLIEINEAYENIFEYKRKDVLGKTSYKLGIWVNKDDRIPIVEALQKEGFYNNFEIRFETKNGAIIDTLVSGRKVLIKNTEYMLTLVNDITHIKNAERAIKESEQKFRSIFENHAAVKLLIDPDTGNIVDANKAAANYYGWTIEELKQMNITQINSLPLEDAIKLMGQIRVNNKSRFEMQHRLKNGTIRDTEIFSSKIEIGGKDYLHAINHDITDRIIAEKKLKEYQNHLEELVDTRTAELDQLNFDLMEQLKKEKEVELLLQDSLAKEKELNNLKNRFISTVSHEFRTPLASIQLSSGLLQRYVVKWPQERMDEHFKRINKSITNLTNLLDGVLTINRADSDKIQFTPKDIDLKNLCESVIDETTPYRLPGHKFDFTYKTKRTTFYLDPNLMHYVLSNLLINAFKYSPNGGEVSLKVSVLRSNLTIVVKDRGIGISAEDLPFLFEPFYRGANVGNVPGSGLGLSIVQKTVEMQNGKIEVRSAKNTGTIFTVGFPIKKEK
jgi:PAS domain S-box-containing protein